MEPEISLLLDIAQKQIEVDKLNERLICLLKENRESLMLPESKYACFSEIRNA